VVAGFRSNALCWSTGLQLEEGRRYRIVLTEPHDWRDSEIPSSLAGFEIGELQGLDTRVTLFTLLPLRRMLDRPWFRPIARIGARGSDEYALDPDQRLQPVRPGPAGRPTDLVAEITARRSGELFLYVNDAVPGVPGLTDVFYRKNHGEARVQVTLLQEE
jgi:hypothetical protein